MNSKFENNESTKCSLKRSKSEEDQKIPKTEIKHRTSFSVINIFHTNVKDNLFEQRNTCI